MHGFSSLGTFMNINERSAALAAKIGETVGYQVYGGPFKGTRLPNIAGTTSPYFLGTYEHELHDIIPQIVARDYKRILNVGCGFGYYACGLARLMPHSTISAIDTNPECIIAVEEMISRNSLSNVKTDATIHDIYDLVVCDIEGGEDDFLFHGADVLVESHECIKPGVTQSLINRFEPSHNIDIIHNRPAFFDLEQIFPGTYIEHFDHAIATWEGRAGSTPWLWMTKKNDAAS